MVSIEDFSKIEIRIGKILEVLDIENAKKPIYELKVDIGESEPRTIAAGIKSFYSKEELIGKKIALITNLEPKVVAGVVSNGMLLAAGDSNIALLVPDRDIEVGSRIR
ncbi:MAG: hypothetical protein ACP5RP_01335 [Candidatus Micrarchaeia archaeon]